MQRTNHFKTSIKKKETMCNNNCSFFCISFKSNQLKNEKIFDKKINRVGKLHFITIFSCKFLKIEYNMYRSARWGARGALILQSTIAGPKVCLGAMLLSKNENF